MADYRLRNYERSEDCKRQYEFWLRATQDLPYAWASNLRNVRYLMKEMDKYPKARIYAEDESGELVGYIGTHPPFDFGDGVRVVPFGYPWTFPRDETLAAALYDQMLESTPNCYGGMRFDLYLQRFRRSWKDEITFMEARGWREKWSYPILAQEIPGVEGCPLPRLMKVTACDLRQVESLAKRDELIDDAPSSNLLHDKLQAGWLSWDAIWILPWDGAFSFEVRDRVAEVKLFVVSGGVRAAENLMRGTYAMARQAGVSTLSFTLSGYNAKRREQFEELGFIHVDDEVFLELSAEA